MVRFALVVALASATKANLRYPTTPGHFFTPSQFPEPAADCPVSCIYDGRLHVQHWMVLSGNQGYTAQTNTQYSKPLHPTMATMSRHTDGTAGQDGTLSSQYPGRHDGTHWVKGDFSMIPGNHKNKMVSAVTTKC